MPLDCIPSSAVGRKMKRSISAEMFPWRPVLVSSRDVTTRICLALIDRNRLCLAVMGRICVSLNRRLGRQYHNTGRCGLANRELHVASRSVAFLCGLMTRRTPSPSHFGITFRYDSQPSHELVPSPLRITIPFNCLFFFFASSVEGCLPTIGQVTYEDLN